MKRKHADKQTSTKTRKNEAGVRRTSAEELASFFQNIAEEVPDRGNLFFLCIGTDMSLGDSLGPLVGTMLQERGVTNVIGTLDRPCDANTFAERTAQLPVHGVVIAIDACIGHPSSVGCYLTAAAPLAPARATGRCLPEAGDYSVAAVVQTNIGHPSKLLHLTPLSRVYAMARSIVRAIEEAGLGGRQQLPQEIDKL